MNEYNKMPLNHTRSPLKALRKVPPFSPLIG